MDAKGVQKVRIGGLEQERNVQVEESHMNRNRVGSSAVGVKE